MLRLVMSSRDAATLGAALAFTAGFVDASGFVGADGVFCAHVTGNFVVLAADLARHAGADEWLKLATFPIFVAAVIASTLWYRRLHVQPGPAAVRRLLLLKVALIGSAASVPWASHAALRWPVRSARASSPCWSRRWGSRTRSIACIRRSDR